MFKKAFFQTESCAIRFRRVIPSKYGTTYLSELPAGYIVYWFDGDA